MNSEQLNHIIEQGEGLHVEFKMAHKNLSKSVFETICAFLNRNGGHILLGVNDDKILEGVHEESVQKLIDDVATLSNNPQKLNPTFYISAKVFRINEVSIIYIYVPESSQVHASAGKIYDRNQDGDFNITNSPNQITKLYLRKQNTYSENQVYPHITISDFSQKVFERVRLLVKVQRNNHPWLEMSNKEMLKSAGLYKKDMQTGKEGYTLAAVLLFGTEQLILNVLPHFKTDAIKRVVDLDRYDDRDDIRVNLIESYDRLMQFIAKHLPDKFYLENDQRKSLRDLIFREIIGNLLIHREYASPYPAKLIIEADNVSTENWNKPNGSGNIDPSNFSPYPKNPMIAKFFKELGRVDELGSGVRNAFKYGALYAPNTKPTFIEDDIFEAIIPLEIILRKENIKNRDKQKNKTSVKIMALIQHNTSITTKELAVKIGISEKGIEWQLNKLKKEHKIKRIGSAKTGFWKLYKN